MFFKRQFASLVCSLNTGQQFWSVDGMSSCVTSTKFFASPQINLDIVRVRPLFPGVPTQINSPRLDLDRLLFHYNRVQLKCEWSSS